MAPELAGQFVEVGAHLVLPAAQRQPQSFRVLLGFGNLGRGLPQHASICENPFDSAPRWLQPVQDALSVAPVLHQSGLLQLRQVRGNAALAHAQDLLQLGHGKLLALHQQQDAEAAGIGQQPQVFED